MLRSVARLIVNRTTVTASTPLFKKNDVFRHIMKGKSFSTIKPDTNPVPPIVDATSKPVENEVNFENSNPNAGMGSFDETPRETYNRRDMYGIYFLLIAAGLTSYLCVWQIRRYFWKCRLIDSRTNQIENDGLTMDEVLRNSMVEFATEIGEVAFNSRFIKHFKEHTEYLPVKLKGKYLYELETLVGYASAPMDVVNTKRRETQRGYFLLTPFELDEPIVIKTPAHDRGNDVEIVIKRIYVNRGWIISTVAKSYLAQPVYERSLHDINGVRGPDIGETTEVSGVLWYGNKCPSDPSKSITSIARDGKTITNQHMHLDIMANRLDEEFTIFTSGENEYEGPTIVVDALTPAPSRRVKALDVEIADNVSTIIISPLRKSVHDYIDFYTTPWNHIAYAVTWGSFCLFSSYLLGAKYLFRETNMLKWFRKKKQYRGNNRSRR